MIGVVLDKGGCAKYLDGAVTHGEGGVAVVEELWAWTVADKEAVSVWGFRVAGGELFSKTAGGSLHCVRSRRSFNR